MRTFLTILMLALFGAAFAMPALASGKDNGGFGTRYFAGTDTAGFNDPLAAAAVQNIEPAAGTEKSAPAPAADKQNHTGGAQTTPSAAAAASGTTPAK